MRVFIDVDDERNLKLIRSWIKENGYEEVREPPFDVVVVNFSYEFPLDLGKIVRRIKKEAVKALLDGILNYEDILVLCDPEDYEKVINYFEKAGDVPVSNRRILAVKALFHLISYLSKFHIRLSELSGVSHYDNKLFHVVNSEFGSGYILEALSESPGTVQGEILHPLLPLYLSTMNAIPKGSFVVFSKGVPVHASLKFEASIQGDVLVYKGEVKEKRNIFTIAEAGKADVLYTPGEEDELLYGSSKFSQKAIREFTEMNNIERLALACITISPVNSIFIFNNEKMIYRRYFIKEPPTFEKLPSGKILATNIMLKDDGICTKYERIIATNASKEIRKRCNSKLLVRRF